MNIHSRLMLQKISKATFCLACLFAVVGAKTTHAQELVGQTIHDLAAYGYVLMDDINTPLLHHVATGAPYELFTLAASLDGMGSDEVQTKTRSKASSKSEFERFEAASEWENFILDRVHSLKNSQGYVIELNTSWGEYDFAKSRMPVQLEMIRITMLHKVWRPSSTFHCHGTYKREILRYGSEFRTACLTAANLNAGDPFLQYFPLQDIALARAIRQSPWEYRIYALAKAAGKYQLTRGKEIRYVPLETYVASGIQPVKITGLVLTRRQGRKILAVSSMSSEPLGAPASPIDPANGGMNNGMVTAPSAATTARGTVSGEWKMLTQDNGTTFYADPSSIKREGGVVLIRQMLDLSEADDSGHRSFVKIFSYACNKRTYRLVSMKGYNQPLGWGGVLSDLATPQDFGSIKPGTIAEVQFNFACNAPVPKN
jgi:hypothetical protein